MTHVRHVDVVVVGAGMSGLAAGLAAAEQGRRVLLLDTAPEPGGSMAISGGLIWWPRDHATARRYLPLGDPALRRVHVERSLDALHWLESHGLPLGEPQACMRGGMGIGREMRLGRAGDRQAFADAMAAAVVDLGGELIVGTGDVGVSGGDWWTVTYDETGDRAEACAPRLVLATGGFQANPELLRRYVTPYASDVVVRSNPHSAGFSVGLADQVGAGLSGSMSSFYGHSFPKLPAGEGIAPIDFIPAAQYYSNSCLAVNRYGQRFCDESHSLIDEGVAEAGARQPEATYYLLFDQDVYDRAVAGGAGLPGVSRSRGNNFTFAREQGAWTATEATLPALLDAVAARGVPLANLRDTVAEFQAAVGGASRLEPIDPIGVLDPPRRDSGVPLATAPFYAIECVAAITATNGGLAVDEHLQVLGSDGTPIDGLYAAGADAGGLNKATYGGGLSWALVSGWLAGLGDRQPGEAGTVPTSEQR